MAANLTESEVADAAAAADLLGAVGGGIVRITADGGYDRLEVYEAGWRVGAKVTIPPRKDAVVSRDPVLGQRNQHIAHRKRVGKRQWRVDTGHHQQARVENTFHRYKRTFGRGLRLRAVDGQLVEVLTGVPDPQPNVRAREARVDRDTSLRAARRICWVSISPCTNAFRPASKHTPEVGASRRLPEALR